MIDLPALPPRMKNLPKDERGYPTPWFVVWLDKAGEPVKPGTEGATPDFRVIAPGKLALAFKMHRCWICGATIVGHAKVFVLGPMCVVNRTTSEPPSHRACAEFAARACPFLVRPRQKRNPKNMPEDKLAPAGIHIDRNPGAVALYQTGTFTPFRAGDGVLFQLGRPIKVDWYAQGRPATREEITESVDSGLPLLLAEAKKQGIEAIRELARMHIEAEKLYPPARLA